MTRSLGLLMLIVLGTGTPVLLSAQVPPGRALPETLFDFSATLPYTNHPVQSTIRGTVTWVDKDRSLIVLQNESRAMAIRADLPQLDLKPGERVTLEGQISRLITAYPDYPDKPTGYGICPTFEGPTNFGENYLTRMRGVLRPPTTGEYTFWIASDDSSELMLSSDANPVNARKIASVETGRWTDPRQWNRFPTQQSQDILLRGGELYYVEALSQQGGGKDCLAVAWQGPGLPPAVIGGQYLFPWPRGDSGPQNINVQSATNGILREYWLNFFSGDLSVLEKPDEFAVNLLEAQLIDRTNTGLPEPLPISAGRSLKPEENFRRVEVQGRLSFAAKNGGPTELELTDGPARIRVHVAGDLAPPPDNSLVRVRGDCEAVRNSNNELVPGNIWVSNPADVAWQDINENWARFKPMAMHLLTRSNPDLVVDRLIQVRGRVIRREAPDAWTIQGDDIFEGYTSSDGTNWNSIGAPLEFTLADSTLVGFAVASHQVNGVAGIKLDHVSGVSPPLENADIGDPPLEGGFEVNGNTFEIRGSGNDIWGSSDQCHFTYQKMAGDGEIVVHVASVEGSDPRAKGGVMIRESLDSQSPWAALLVGPSHRVGLQARREAGKNASGIIQILPAEWLKLTRHRQNLLIRTDSSEELKPGQVVDMMGKLSWEAERPVLRNVRVRINPETVGLRSDNPPTDTQAPAGELHNVPIGDLTIEADKVQLAGRAPHFRICGVVTFNGQVAGEPLFFVQDSSGACLVRPRTSVSREFFQVGHIVELTGNSAQTNSMTEFIPNGISDLGVGALPRPLSYPFEDFTTEGKQYGQWTEIAGIVRSIDKNNTLSVMTRDGLLPVWIGSGLTAPITHCVNALVRIRGVLWQTPSRTLLTPSEDFIEIKEPSFKDAFNIPTFTVARLRELNIVPQTAHRLKIAGVVTCAREDFFFVQDESGGIRVENKIPSDIKVGDEIEVIGFPSREAIGLTMTEASVRKKGSVNLALPVEFSVDQATDERNNQLVSLDATLLDQQLWRGVQTLELQSGQRAFRAVLPMSGGKLPPIAKGSRVRLTGVSEVESSPNRAAGGDMPIVASLELLLRSPNDILVLERPPWWNWKYTVAGFCTLALVLIVSLIWIRMLRRRVEQKTQQLRETMDKLQKETRISATLAERDRLAGEIHDSLEQGLSAIMMQMEAAAKLVHRPEEVGHYLTMARNMASFSRTEVQNAVWDLQSPMLENADLGTALHQVARDISSGDTPHVTVKVTGEARSLPSFVEHHLLRIGQEAITNAVKHGNPKTVALGLDYGSQEITLAVRDDGCGFDPQTVAAGNGHFGLQGIRVRARKINGALTISSKPREGTSIQIVVPVGHSSQNPES